MKRGQSNRYYVSYKRDMEHFLVATVTIDEAFFQSGKLSKSDSSSFVVWNFEEDGSRRVRAFANDGHATWAQVCKKCKGKGESCYSCAGMGATL
jgi:D-hexose-6-phosphate mutarotase